MNEGLKKAQVLKKEMRKTCENSREEKKQRKSRPIPEILA